MNTLLNYTRDTYNPISAKSELYIYNKDNILVPDIAENRMKNNPNGTNEILRITPKSMSGWFRQAWKSIDPNLVTCDDNGIIKYGTPIVSWPYVNLRNLGDGFFK